MLKQILNRGRRLLYSLKQVFKDRDSRNGFDGPDADTKLATFLAFDPDFCEELKRNKLTWATDLKRGTLKHLLSEIEEYRCRSFYAGGGAAWRARRGLDSLKIIHAGGRDAPMSYVHEGLESLKTILDSELNAPNATPLEWTAWFESRGLEVEWIDCKNAVFSPNEVPQDDYVGWGLRRLSDPTESLQFSNGPLHNGPLHIVNNCDVKTELWSVACRFVALFPDIGQKPLFSDPFRKELFHYKYTQWSVFPDLTRADAIQLLSAVTEYATNSINGGNPQLALDALKKIVAFPQPVSPFKATKLEIAASQRNPCPIEWVNVCKSKKLDVVWISPKGNVTNPDDVSPDDYAGWYLRCCDKVALVSHGVEFVAMQPLTLKCDLTKDRILCHAIFQFISTFPEVDIVCAQEDCYGVRIWGDDWARYVANLAVS